MLYPSSDAWHGAKNKRIMVFGMSGLGKTHLSMILRNTNDWYHYSVDYRIGTRYMSEHIVDSCLKEAMKNDYLREMLRSDAIYLAGNVHAHDLSAVSTYLGKPGDTKLGGLAIDEYKHRQSQFKRAEEQALYDTDHFINRGCDLYEYPHFICDTGGSICEWVDIDDPNDPLMQRLSASCLPVWIKGDQAHTQELVRRFDRAPKPMAYQPQFLNDAWSKYMNEFNTSGGKVNPNDFVRWTYEQALHHRQPRYEAMANWGVTVSAEEVADIQTAEAFEALIAKAISRK